MEEKKSRRMNVVELIKFSSLAKLQDSIDKTNNEVTKSKMIGKSNDAYTPDENDERLSREIELTASDKVNANEDLTQQQQWNETTASLGSEKSYATTSSSKFDIALSRRSFASANGQHVDFVANRPNNEHFCVRWRNLNYVVRPQWTLRESRISILDSLSGYFRSGQLTAILGPSGAGKSTLVDCLIGRLGVGGTLSGETKVEFDDASVEADRRKNRPVKIAVIPQEDHLLDSLTVTEALLYASRIKNATDYKSMAEHKANVQRVLRQLSLESCAKSRCSTLSGGQYKRVSIGQELLAWPDILILDEPTSGLDSITCFQVVDALRRLVSEAPHPLAVLATIHQPDVEVLALFDKLYVLASGGRALYSGSASDIPSTVSTVTRQVRANRARRRQLANESTSKLSERVSSPHSDKDSACCSPDSSTTVNCDEDTASGTTSATIYGDEYDCKLSELEMAAQAENVNPARLIVSIAAEEYGYEMVGALCSAQKDSCTPDASKKVSNQTNNPLHVQFDYALMDPRRNKQASLDSLLCLAANNKKIELQRPYGVFWTHVRAHTSRSWLTIVRDPMLCSVQILLHIFVPLLISYCFQKHEVDACPRIEPLNIIAEAYSNTTILGDVNRELRLSLEAQGYFFIQLYVIIFAAICGYALTYPLAMKVLLKEYRNGWYSVSSYFVGRTLADLPICSANVVLALSISYFLTGQAHSEPYEWRFSSLASLAVLATLVAQTQGLLFGALLMNSPQSTVFVAPASTAPLVIVSGFLLRLESLPMPLQIFSKLSYFTHLMSGALVSRYGFNKCNCSQELWDNLSEIDESQEIPQAARTLIDIWIESYANEYTNQTHNSSLLVSTTTTPTTLQVFNTNSTLAINSTTKYHAPDVVGKLLHTVQSAKTFGFEINSCKDVRPFALLDNSLDDSTLPICFASLVAMLAVCRLLTFLALRWTISRSL